MQHAPTIPAPHRVPLPKDADIDLVAHNHSLGSLSVTNGYRKRPQSSFGGNLENRIARRVNARTDPTPVFVPTELHESYESWTQHQSQSAQKARQLQKEKELERRRERLGVRMSSTVLHASSGWEDERHAAISRTPNAGVANGENATNFQSLPVSKTSLADLKLLKAESLAKDAPAYAKSHRWEAEQHAKSFRASRAISSTAIAFRSLQPDKRPQSAAALAVPHKQPDRELPRSSSPLGRPASSLDNPVVIQEAYEQWLQQYAQSIQQRKEERREFDEEFLGVVSEATRKASPPPISQHLAERERARSPGASAARQYVSSPMYPSSLRPMTPPSTISPGMRDRSSHGGSPPRAEVSPPPAVKKTEGRPYTVLTYGFKDEEFGVLKQRAVSSAGSRSGTHSASRPKSALSTHRSEASEALHILDYDSDDDVLDDRNATVMSETSSLMGRHQPSVTLMPVQNVPLLFGSSKRNRKRPATSLVVRTSTGGEIGVVTKVEPVPKPQSAKKASQQKFVSPEKTDKSGRDSASPSQTAGMQYAVRKRPATALMSRTKQVLAVRNAAIEPLHVEGSPIAGW
jgi:hypothetical protein